MKDTSIMMERWLNWQSAHQSLPNDARLFALNGYIERHRPGGNQEEALRYFERAIELDPRNSSLATADRL